MNHQSDINKFIIYNELDFIIKILIKSKFIIISKTDSIDHYSLTIKYEKQSNYSCILIIYHYKYIPPIKFMIDSKKFLIDYGAIIMRKEDKHFATSDIQIININFNDINYREQYFPAIFNIINKMIG